jgi:hypothetical protein
MDDYYRERMLDVKCTKCAKDGVFICNKNASRETELIDIHCLKGQMTVIHGGKILFNGDPLKLMQYPREVYLCKKDEPPPERSSFYSLWVNHFKIP